MHMNNAGESNLFETVSSIVNGIGDWFGIAIPTAQANVWWVSASFLLIAILLSVSTHRSRKRLVPPTPIWRRMWRGNPTVSGMRHARR